MKTKVYLSVLFGAVSMLSLTACSSDDNESVDNNIIRISTQIANGPDASATRAAADIQSTAFQNGETIKIYAVDNQSTSTKIIDNAIYTQGSGFTASYYYPANGHTIDIYGIYPSTLTYMTSNSFSVQDNQYAEADYKASDLMQAQSIDAARKSEAQALTFNHKLSKIIVNVKKDASVVNAESVDLQLLNVKKTVNLSYSPSFTVALDNSATPGAVTIVPTDNRLALSADFAAVAAIIPPQTIAATTQFIKVHLNSGGEYIYAVPAGGITFAAGTVYTYNITVGLYGITVSTSIANWTPGNGEGTGINATI